MVHTTEAIVRLVLLAVEVVLALPVLYLLILSLAALLPRRHHARGAAERSVTGEHDASYVPHFALLVPAHDEERDIGNLLSSIAALQYPAARRDVYVIADNCNDATADVAREVGVLGISVCERHDPEHASKGHALRWMLHELDRAGRVYDAYLIVDADSALSPTFLEVMAAHLAQGEVALQAQYRVQNGDSSWAAGLRAVAFALFNHLRPLGRSVLGWSAGLKGNGMCFSRQVIERFGWGTYSLAEDAEYHLALVSAGIRVAYVPEAVVTSAMPTTLAKAGSQQHRWERGRLVLARRHAARLVYGALRYRDPARLDAIAEVCLPPISLLAGLLVVVVGASAALWWMPELLVAGALILAFALHAFAGMILARLSPRAYLSLLYAPLYILWKIGVYLRAAVSRGSGPWVRTSRA